MLYNKIKTSFLSCLLFTALLCGQILHAEVLYIGMEKSLAGNNTSKKDFTIGMEIFVKEFAQKENIEFEITYYETAQALAEDFRSDKINFVVADALSFIQYFDKEQLIPSIMAYKTNKEDSNNLLLLKRKEDTRTLHQILQGKAIHNGDASINLYLQTLLLEKSIKNSETFLSKNGKQSILKLFFKKGDYALVDEASYKLALELNPQLQEKLEIMESTPLKLETLTYMNATMSKELHEKIIKSGLSLNETSRGKQLIQMFKATKIDTTSTSELDTLYKLQAKYDALASKK
jgi:hypothetical protein